VYKGASRKFSVLHIGKTAGASISDLAEAAVEAGHTPPMIFGHDWTLRAIVDEFPRTRVAFVLRDPLLRIISGFQSRLRQGRPRNQNMWKVEEAVSFAFFSDAHEFLCGLIGSDERLKSAALFAQRSVRHVRRGYVHHFESVAVLKRYQGRIYFLCDVDGVSAGVFEMFEPAGVPRDFVSETYLATHRAGGSTEHIHGRLSNEQLAKLRSHFAAEYEIYDYLRELLPRFSGDRGLASR
jgi:hypothetical protein